MPENSILIKNRPSMPNTNGVKKLIYAGKKEVIFFPWKLFKQKSNIPKKKNKAPNTKKVFKFSLLGLNKFILFIFYYFSCIAIRLLYQFINRDIKRLIVKYVAIVIPTISIALPVCIIAVPANTNTKSG